MIQESRLIVALHVYVHTLCLFFFLFVFALCAHVYHISDYLCTFLTER